MSRLLPSLLLCCVAISSHAAPAQRQTPTPPNILVLLADDMGFSDAGCYGGEISTPNLDKLAKEGLRFTQAYNTARCWPTRASILTGFYAQHVRRDSLPEHPESGGVKGRRPDWARLLPSLLQPAGYHSYHSGKWHVDQSPLSGGFEHSYSVDDHDRYFAPKRQLLDDAPLPTPAPGYYATTAIAEHALQFLKQHTEQSPKAPFFAYVAFTSPHFPLQAPQEDIDRCRGRFKEGSDVLRAARLSRLWAMGMLTNGELSDPTAPAKPWNALSPEEQAAFTTRMEIHAAMIERMDREIGRILDYLRATGALDNTLVMFLSDNGASAESLVRGDGNPTDAIPGSEKSFLCLEAQGANLANTPLRYSKKYVHEGGISTPLIVRWPNGFKAKDELREQPVHVVDIAPTLLKIAGVPWPKLAGEMVVPPSDGIDLTSVFKENKPLVQRALWWSHEEHCALRIGDWKWVAEKGHDPELFYMRGDRSETRNLASANAERLKEMETLWGKFANKFLEDTREPSLTNQTPLTR